jgi:hypothetical protein
VGDSDLPRSFPSSGNVPFAPAPNWRLETAIAARFLSYNHPHLHHISRAGDEICLPPARSGNLLRIRQRRLRFNITLIGLLAAKKGGLQDFEMVRK